MSQPAPTQATPMVHERTLRMEPTFLRALRGVWLFTWKSQVGWRRLASGFLGMLGLPVLIYLTTSSPQAWDERHLAQMGNPSTYLSGFSRRLARSPIPLKAPQQAELSRILAEEFSRAQSEFRGARSRENGDERQRQVIEACNERIRERARAVLDEPQFAQFQNYQRKNRVERPPPVMEQGWDRTAPFYHWLIDVYFFIIVPLNCVRMCGALIRDELEADTLSFLTTRPLSRARLLVIKFFAQTAWLQITLLVQTLLLFAAAGLRDIPALGTFIPVFLGVQLLAVWAWSALGSFLGQVAKNYMALALLYGGVVEMAIGRIPTNINTLSLMFHMKTLLGHNPALQAIYQWPAVGVAGPVGALVLGAAMFLTLAALLFTFREYHHVTETQK